ELKKENDELNRLVNELSVNNTPLQTESFLQSESFNADGREEDVDSQKKLDEYLSYEQESKEMKAQLDQLKSMVRDLNSELETYAKENLTGYNSGSALVEKKQDENDVLKTQYDDILHERSVLLTEKNRLTEENNQLSQKLFVLNEQLKASNQNYNERIQELISIYESNAEEFIKNHQKTLSQLTENIKNSLSLVKFEGDDLSNLKKILFAEKNHELKS
ncbi:MAG: hypothetical protein KJ779_02085, partial [Firmicutes bacterium]|nr:hypothetical protein [Bacillota bacterium]